MQTQHWQDLPICVSSLLLQLSPFSADAFPAARPEPDSGPLIQLTAPVRVIVLIIWLFLWSSQPQCDSAQGFSFLVPPCLEPGPHTTLSWSLQLSSSVLPAAVKLGTYLSPGNHHPLPGSSLLHPSFPSLKNKHRSKRNSYRGPSPFIRCLYSQLLSPADPPSPTPTCKWTTYPFTPRVLESLCFSAPNSDL